MKEILRGPRCLCCVGRDRDNSSLAAGVKGIVWVARHMPPDKADRAHRRRLARFGKDRPRMTPASLATHYVLVHVGQRARDGRRVPIEGKR